MISVQREPIDLSALTAAVEGRADGAVVLFLGRVRDRNRERAVEQLDYDAYEPMARAEMEELARAARADHGASRVAMVHRTGRLQIGELAVAIAVSSPHRQAAFLACQWLIDELKERVPIWKKEWYGDGSEWVSPRP